MTKLAVISDVHADVHALRDALVQIDRIGVERIVCCGDLLDYGLFPDETLSLLREKRISCILDITGGNVAFEVRRATGGVLVDLR